MNVVLVNGPAAGRVCEVSSSTYWLEVPYMDLEDQAKLVAVWEEDGEIPIPIQKNGPTFKVAVYRRDSRHAQQMYCVSPVPRTEKCPTCLRPI